VLDPWETLKLIADPTRLRLLNLLEREELSVAELQEILGMGQSRISSHLALLRQGELVLDRKEGKRAYYSPNPELPSALRNLVDAACTSVAQREQIKADRLSLQRILDKRRRLSEQYFNAVAGRLGKNYCPGRSWEALGHMLLHLTPRIVVADLGAGEGMVSLLLARRAEKVYCIDNSPRMVEFGTESANRHGVDNLEYRLGDIEEVPLPDRSVDLALLSQALHHAIHPEKAIAEAYRILKPRGRLIILDLKEHTFEKARELYADRWLGFTENTLYTWLREKGFMQIEVHTVARESQEPYFETLLASGTRK
jgi:ubiquinone/menaquinone biosynthesis C-methylase UbiE/DNA-binding transcriptional ArsR family regulator